MSSLSIPESDPLRQQEADHVRARHEIDAARLTPGPGFGAMPRNVLLFLGVVGILVVIAGAFTTAGSDEESRLLAQRHALTSYHMGFLYALGIALGCLGFQMILQQFNAGWSAVPRRTAETIASLFPFVAVLGLPIAIIEFVSRKGLVFSWIPQAFDTTGHVDHIYHEKSGWLNPTFWIIRAVLYFIIWIGLGSSLYNLSRRQDVTGDRWLTARARWISSFGLLIFALSATFASFDWLMGMDYHWFSTMFGVYFFAGCTISAIAVLCIILCTLRITGRLGKTFTEEHQHDLGKLLFAFTVFWAYVTFAQYFLIWYSNVPEESAFYNLRNDYGYKNFFLILCYGHFLLPFVLLLIRPIKRNPVTLIAVSIWMLVMHAVDIVYMARPVLTRVGPATYPWIDVAGIVGPVCLLMGVAIWKMGRAPLVPLKDPRLHEVLAHKNYV